MHATAHVSQAFSSSTLRLSSSLALFHEASEAVSSQPLPEALLTDLLGTPPVMTCDAGMTSDHGHCCCNRLAVHLCARQAGTQPKPKPRRQRSPARTPAPPPSGHKGADGKSKDRRKRALTPGRPRWAEPPAAALNRP